MEQNTQDPVTQTPVAAGRIPNTFDAPGPAYTPPASGNYEALPGVTELRQNDQRFAYRDDDYCHVGEFEREGTRGLRDQVGDLFAGRGIDGRELAGNLFKKVFGDAVGDQGRDHYSPADEMRERGDGVIRDRYGSRNCPPR